MPEPEVLFVAAEAGELRGLLSKCAGVCRASLPVQFARSGMLNGMRVTAVANGPGPELAAAAARVADRAAAIVSTGFCGALAPSFRTGDLFVASHVNGVECDRPSTSRPYHTGTLASLDHVVTTVAEKRRLYCSGGPVAIDMESCAVAAASLERGVPFYCIRAVLDAAEEGFTLDFNRLRDNKGRFSRERIIAAALAQPLTGVPELIRLVRRGRFCSRVLGDFLADCRF